MNRGQTTIDFAIGVSIFLLTAAFIFTFVPGMVEPFESGPQEETVVADRLASQLAGGMLGDPAQPYVLGTACTTEFFADAPNTAIDCRFDQRTDLTAGGTITERLGVSDRQRVYVELVGDTNDDGTRSVLCSDGSTILEPGQGAFSNPCSSAVVTLSLGDEPPGGLESVVVARRLVTVDAKEVTLVVRAW